MTTKFKQRLRQAGQKVTRQRLAVFDFLQRNDPTTMQAVIAGVADVMDRASAYRTMNLFRQLDIAHDIVAGGRRMIELSDAYDFHHHHITCIKCGRHESIEDEAIEQRLAAVARSRGFEPTSHQVQISGLCRHCRQ